MPIPKDYKDIIEKLAQATEDDRVNWQASRFGAEVIMKDSQFQIWAGTDEEVGRPFVSFALADKTGASIDTWYVDENEGDYASMQRLYAAARRKAHGIDKRLDSIREALDEASVIGESKKDDDWPF